MNFMRLRAVVGVGSLVLLAGCNSRELTRDRAASLIAAVPAFAQLAEAAKVIPQGRELGVAQGKWNREGGITVKGQEDFSGWPSYNRLGLRRQLKRSVVEITGIADAVTPLAGTLPGSKEVQFRWEYANVEGPVRRFVVTGGTGVAILRLFDDGWRVEDLKTQEGTEGFSLNASEQAAAEGDRQTETARQAEEAKRVAEEARRTQEREQRLAALVAASKNPTKTIGTFNGTDAFVGRPLKVVLTDVGVSNGDKSPWFVDMRGRQPEKDDFQQTAFGWKGFRVNLISSSDLAAVIFKDRAERDRFYEAVTKALAEWRDKYREIQ